MKFSENWLKEFINPDASSEQIVERLSLLGLEVDSVEPAAPLFSGVVVGEVLSFEDHPNADKLTLCQIDVGQDEPIAIICGAPNIRHQNLKVAVATVGAVLPGDFKIKKAKLRGIESNGMICSSRELGLSDDHDGIMHLPADAVVGTDFRNYYDLDDQIVDIDLTPNRGDCASLKGVARDLAAFYGVEVCTPKIEAVESTIKDQITIDVKNPEACPRYLGRVIKNINPKATTPLWLSEKLRRSGLRSIHPVVDVLNFVMMELGQPMHAFDVAKLTGDIIVRAAKSGEKIKVLDEREITLNDTTLVIADEKEAIAIAGMMGSLDSSVTLNTTDIFLESAFFAPLGLGSFAVNARKYQMFTDAAFRYERGVDYELPKVAMERATQILLDIVGGEAGPVVTAEDHNYLPKPVTIELTQNKVTEILGLEISCDEITRILKRLGMTVVASSDAEWKVIVPSFRSDITIPVDLIEEVIRIHGFDHLPMVKPNLKVDLPKTSEASLEHDFFKQQMVGRGFTEMMSYSFVDPKDQQLLDPKQAAIKLSNPISQDMSVMRTNLWPGLLKAAQYNLNRQVERLRLFEMGTCFNQDASGEIIESFRIAGLIIGELDPKQWGEKSRKADFYDIKADVEALIAPVGRLKDISYSDQNLHPSLHPGQSASLMDGDEVIGWIGALHPAKAKALQLKQQAFLFEILVPAISCSKITHLKVLSKFPSVSRDIAILVDETVKIAEIRKEITEIAGKLLISVQVFDIYRGEGIPSDQKSVALGLIFQSFEKTLNDEDVDKPMAKILESLKERVNATLRT